MSTPTDNREMHRAFFEQLAANERYEERILCHPSYSEYCIQFFELGTDSIHNYVPSIGGFPQDEEDMIYRFINVNLTDFYRQWVNGGKKMPLDRLVELSGALVGYGLSGFVKLSG